MPTTETTIANLALGKLGAKTIIDLTEESTEARVCRLHYAETRDEVLRYHRWNFAIRRIELAASVDPPLYGWAYQYQLPVDCLRVIEVNGWELGARPKAWEIEGLSLMLNDSEAKIRYLSRVTDCNKFDSVFVEALSTRLASKIAMPINGSSEMASQFLTEYEKITGSRARRTDSFEGRPARHPAWKQSDLVSSRFGVR